MEIKINDYIFFKDNIINNVDNILNENSDIFESELKAFNMYVAKLFGNYNTIDQIVFSDNKSDQGIDFYIINNDSLQIFQSKFLKFETLRKNENPISFNDDGVKDLENAYNYLFNNISKSPANDKVKGLRAKIQIQDFEKISFNLCVIGYLTEDAKEKFKNLQTFRK